MNLVLYGTSFTARLRAECQADPNRRRRLRSRPGGLILARIQDFASAVLHPGRNERLQFVAAWLNEEGVDLSDPAAEKRIILVLLENTRRVLGEQRAYSRAIDSAKQAGDAGSVFVARFQSLSRPGLVAGYFVPAELCN